MTVDRLLHPVSLNYSQLTPAARPTISKVTKVGNRPQDRSGTTLSGVSLGSDEHAGVLNNNVLIPSGTSSDNTIEITGTDFSVLSPDSIEVTVTGTATAGGGAVDNLPALTATGSGTGLSVMPSNSALLSASVWVPGTFVFTIKIGGSISAAPQAITLTLTLVNYGEV